VRLHEPRAIAMSKESIRIWEGPEPKEVTAPDRDQADNINEHSRPVDTNSRSKGHLIGRPSRYSRRANATSHDQTSNCGAV
jgi:hypothetical protein